MNFNISSVLSFLGNYAGRSASEWTQKAVEWAAQPGSHFGNISDCAYNAAKAALGSDAPWSQINSYAQAIIHSLGR